MSESAITGQPAQWSAPAHVKALTTLRTGGVSTGSFSSLNLAAHVGDDRATVEENRVRLAEQLGLPSAPIWLRQVHGRRVVQAESCQRDCIADGSFSREAGIVCAVLTADCIPLFLTDKLGRFVCLLHVGWRGLAAGVIESGLTAVAAKPQELLAWVGPGIGRDEFVVGGEGSSTTDPPTAGPCASLCQLQGQVASRPGPHDRTAFAVGGCGRDSAQ